MLIIDAPRVSANSLMRFQFRVRRDAQFSLERYSDIQVTRAFSRIRKH